MSSTLAPTTREAQHALCAQLIAAGLAPGEAELLKDDADIEHYWLWLPSETPDAFGRMGILECVGIWRPWCDIQAVWHLVLRFGLSIGPCPTEHATSPRDTWRVEHAEASLNCADAGDIPYIVCVVALALVASAAQKGPVPSHLWSL